VNKSVKGSFVFVFSWKDPELVVVVPVTVPFTCTLTCGIGALETASITWPDIWIRLSCAEIQEAIKRKKIENKILFNLSFS
jgi:hypothetical protein